MVRPPETTHYIKQKLPQASRMHRLFMKSISRIAALAALVSIALAFPAPSRAENPSGFVGVQVCTGCHQQQSDLWRGSHHALAMQPATEATVIGDFSGATVSHFGVLTTLSRADGKFRVHTDGPDGALHDYDIAYTFGVAPLQQYLIALPGGRLQALGIAWDSRPKTEGGQRWFQLYPDQKLPAGDRLHWTGRDQTWNYQCADCHSTNLSKNYDLTTDTYKTSWVDVDVSCEACHGPGARHVAWAQPYTGPQARKPLPAASPTEHFGLTNWLKPTDDGHWEMNAETGIAQRTEKLVSAELDTCAACHSRRRPIVPNALPGPSLLDSYAPALLEPGLYHADGQIDGEVFEYGSFVQSRMYQAGVTCSNCHEPHSATLRAEGNTLCAQCHMPEKFDTAAHTHHPVGSTGAQCVNCHMPTKNYMVVDARRDHSFRIPRPDLTTSIGVPNACTQCHTRQSPEWASRAIAEWYPKGRQTQPHYGTALNAGRTGALGAEHALDQVILDPTVPAIARASALLLLPRIATRASAPALQAAITDNDPLVRAAVPRALPASLPPPLVQATAALFADPVRTVRIEAARALAGIDPQALAPDQRDGFAKAMQELHAAEMVNADRPEAHLNLGLLDLRQRQPAEAQAEYQTALRLDPTFVPAMVNLADLDRISGQDQQGADMLRKAMATEPDNADVRYSLGLLFVRQHNYAEALVLLRRASELAPNNPRYSYVYAIALSSSGAPDQAIAELERAHRQTPGDRDVLIALVSIAREKGDLDKAQFYGSELMRLNPVTR